MKKTLITGTLVAAGLVLGAPLAHADSDKYAYIAALNKVAEPGTEDSQLNNGYVICEALNQHQDAVSVMTQVAPRANLTIDWSGYMVGARDPLPLPRADLADRRAARRGPVGARSVLGDPGIRPMTVQHVTGRPCLGAGLCSPLRPWPEVVSSRPR
ncbi:MAG: hypothetical protein QOE20_2727 [Mycobacterium sp.]|jgi:hypothetical protein|nr:hypothetical protein [Mycobacterium sp.]